VRKRAGARRLRLPTPPDCAPNGRGGGEGNRNTRTAEGHHRLAKSVGGSFDSGPNAGESKRRRHDSPSVVWSFRYGVGGYVPGTTRPVSGFTCVGGGAPAMWTMKLPPTGSPEAVTAFALPESPAAIV
jgi:hypothetical protein